MKFSTVALSLCVVLWISKSQAREYDFYSSVSAISVLVAAESMLIESLENLIVQKKASVKVIKKYLRNFGKISDDSSVLFDNPLNAFKMIHRGLNDFPELKQIILKTTHIEDYQRNLTELETGVLPTNEDVSGASMGLARLQNIYQLPTEDVADGILMDYVTSPPMNAVECFEVGRNLYVAQNYKYALEWLTEARLRLHAATRTTSLSEVRILEYLGSAYYALGNWKMSVKIYRELLELEPTNAYGLKHSQSAEKHLQESRRLSLDQNAKPVPTTTPQSTVIDMYEKVCRGELKQTPQEQRDLRCRYSSRNVPFCRLAPFRMEELSLDPYVAYFHEVITDAEIEQILNESEEHIKRSRVGNNENSMVSEVRTSQNTWLAYSEHDFLKNFGQRLTDITGLTLETAEQLQVANYGIGGHYGPHYDFLEGESADYRGTGNRILTALFYINDVELGGGTGFPFLRLLVPPIKRSMVMWYNLHESLEEDYRTKHAGCPVLKGSKWICNEWFHSKSQEFRRPCGLQPTGNSSIAYQKIV